MQPSIMSLVLAIAPMCSVAPRFAVFRPATLAPHTPGTTSGTHACTQQMQHLDSNHYHDATSGAGPESGRVPRVHGGRSTRGLVGRTPLVLLPSSYGSTSGRGLTSCCMRAGEIEPYNGVVLPQLARRPPGARFCCPVPMRARSSSVVLSRRHSLHCFLLFLLQFLLQFIL